MAKEITYNSNKYRIDGLQYPEDLDTSAEYGRNKVVFLINVSGGAKFNKARESSNQTVMDIPKDEYNATAARTALDSSGAVDATIDKLELQQSLKAMGKMKRLTAAISLYIPNDLNIGYNVSWGEEDLSGSELLAETVSGFVGSFKNKSATEGAGEAAGVAVTGVATKLGSTALNNIPALAKALRATPGNAKAEQLFKAVDFRTFTFNYSFAPRSKSEAESVLRIIRMFRHHMLPEFADENKFIYVYPSEFEVKYYRGDKENEYLEKHFTAVLTNCSINYTPNGQFVTFGGESDGMPAQINMTLAFKELSLASKETSPFDKSGI